MTKSNLIHLDVERMKRRGDKPMRGAEKIVELEWLLDAGVHPSHAVAQLGTNLGAMTKMCRDYDRHDLAARVKRLENRADLYSGKNVEPPTGRAA